MELIRHVPPVAKDFLRMILHGGMLACACRHPYDIPLLGLRAEGTVILRRPIPLVFVQSARAPAILRGYAYDKVAATGLIPDPFVAHADVPDIVLDVQVHTAVPFHSHEKYRTFRRKLGTGGILADRGRAVPPDLAALRMADAVALIQAEAPQNGLPPRLAYIPEPLEDLPLLIPYLLRPSIRWPLIGHERNAIPPRTELDVKTVGCILHHRGDEDTHTSDSIRIQIGKMPPHIRDRAKIAETQHNSGCHEYPIGWYTGSIERRSVGVTTEVGVPRVPHRG